MTDHAPASERMNPERNLLASQKVLHVGTNLNTWIGVAAAVGSFLVLVFGAGMYFSVIRALPEQLNEVKSVSNSNFNSLTTQISSLTTQGQATQVLLAGTRADVSRLSGMIDANNTDDQRQWEILRATQAKAEAALPRETFMGWQYEYERSRTAPYVPPTTR